MMIQKTIRKIQGYKLVAALTILVILLLLLGITHGSLGKFSRSFIMIDSAVAAKFDVVITPPEAFSMVQGDGVYEYRFLSDTDFQRLAFQVTNNGETEVLCRPHINNDITYRVYVGEEMCSDFIVPAKETVNFLLSIAPDGLDTIVREAQLFVDIKQVEGGA